LRVIDFIRGDSLAWITEHVPSRWAVLLIDPGYGIDYACGSVPRRKFADGIMGDESTAGRDAVLDWWGVGERPAAVFGSADVPHYGEPRGVLTWDKMGAAGMGDLSFPWKPDNNEEIAVYGPGWSGPRSSSVLSYCPVRGADGKAHPHEKPIALLEHILSKAPPGPVLDLFGGSGSTAEAAHRLGRDCTIVELDPRWWPALQARVDRLHSQLDLFASAG
jgi:hypothetical protein